MKGERGAVAKGEGGYGSDYSRLVRPVEWVSGTSHPRRTERKVVLRWRKRARSVGIRIANDVLQRFNFREKFLIEKEAEASFYQEHIE